MKKTLLLTALLMSSMTVTLAQSRLDLGLRRQLKQAHETTSAAAKGGKTQAEKLISFRGVLNEGATLPVDELKAMGMEVEVQIGQVVLLCGPISALEQVDKLEAFLGFEAPSKALPGCKTARETTGVSLMDTDQGAKSLGLPAAMNGDGVIIGVYDAGIQFSHPNFRDQTTGKSRIIAAMTSQADPANTGKRIYNVYKTADEISKLKPVDLTSTHGTHTAGIAGGSYTEQGLHGIATKADLILGEDPSLSFAQGIKDMCAIADEQKKPLVINLSILSNYGWGDDKCTEARVIRELTNEGKKPGRIICLCAANEANAKCGLHGTFQSEGQYFYSFIKPSNVDEETNEAIYYGNETNFYSNTADSIGVVQLYAYDINKKDFVDINNVTATMTVNNKRVTKPVLELVEWGTENSALHDNRWHGAIQISDTLIVNRPNTVLGFGVKATGNVPVTFTIKSRNADQLVDLESYGVEYAFDGTNYYSLSDLICNEASVSVGAYSDRDYVTGLDGKTYKGNNAAGEIVYWSAFGTTFYGTNKPDLVAPGDMIISSANKYNTNYFGQNGEILNYVYDNYPLTNAVEVTVDGVKSKEYWVADSGTSMSTPIVAGVVALMLQVNPNLTTLDVRRILTETAITDQYTKAAGIQAGAGKLNAKAAVLEAYKMATGIHEITDDITSDSNAVQKRLINGRIYIIKDNKAYSTDGTQMTMPAM